MLSDGEATQFRSEPYIDTSVQTELQRCGEYLARPCWNEEMGGSSERFGITIGAADVPPPMQLLDLAVTHLRCGDWRVAGAEYAAAIRMADSVDWRELQREREWLRRKIDAESDPLTRRSMVEHDRLLHEMERAPGFTRANLGLLLVRQGHLAEGFSSGRGRTLF